MNRWRTHEKSPHQKAVRNADDAVSIMVRARDEGACILFEANECDPRNKMECGHFIQRELMATRFHPCNLNKECSACNSSHVSGFRPDKGFPYSLAIDAKYGNGCALFLYNLSHPKHEIGGTRDESWTIQELEQLKSAARMGSRVYEQIYYELRPHHLLPKRKKRARGLIPITPFDFKDILRYALGRFRISMWD